MNKQLQTVYIPIKPSENINSGIIAKYINIGNKFPIYETRAYVFTPEELRQLLSDTLDRGKWIEQNSYITPLNLDRKEEYIKEFFK